MEPSTPPRSSRSREIPATPATPRFGSFGDLPDHPRKPQVNSSNESNGHGALGPASLTPHRRKRSVNLATPRRTPKKRKEAVYDARHDIQEGADRDLFLKLSAPGPTAKTEAQRPGSSKSISRSATDGKSGLAHSPELAPQTEGARPHPHQDGPPPDVPGMWYVFRGKKVFRPFPKGEQPIEPVTLFKDQIDHSRRRKQNDLFQDETDSEADTDMEF